MTDKSFEEITIGLSDAEKDDLEKMIKAFKEKQPAEPETLAQYGDILLKFDVKLKLLYGILRLSDQKNRILDQRIKAALELLKGQNILTEE